MRLPDTTCAASVWHHPGLQNSEVRVARWYSGLEEFFVSGVGEGVGEEDQILVGVARNQSEAEKDYAARSATPRVARTGTGGGRGRGGSRAAEAPG